MDESKQIKVTLFYRKPWPSGSFSIETSFHTLEKHFPKDSKFKLQPFVSSFPSSGILNRFKSIIEARKNSSEINHITGDVHFLLFGLLGKKSILTIHDCGFINNSNLIKKIILKWIWLKLPAKLATMITAVSCSTKQDILKYSGVSEEKIIVIPTIISDSYNFSVKESKPSIPNILHIGSTPNKNLERHVLACSKIDCTLTIVGELNKSQKDLLNLHDINYKNRFDLNNTEITQLYRDADILLFASTLEGFGMPIIEAQSVGRPVVTSNISSMPEVAGENGACFVDPYNVESIKEGILKVWNNDDYRNSLIANGKENIKRFSTNIIAQQYEQIYEKVSRN